MNCILRSILLAATAFAALGGPALAQAPQAKHHRGAKSSRHHWLAYQETRHPAFAHTPVKAPPPQFVPATILATNQMSYWGNSKYGDCVTAEEFFAKDIYTVYASPPAATPLNMPEALAIQWAGQHGFLNGANLTEVMDAVIRDGIKYNGTTYTDGAYQSVNYTDWGNLTSAISQGPVKIGVAAGQFDSVPGVGSRNGWLMVGLAPDQNEDHCVSLCGYGTVQYLATAMGIQLPAGVDGTKNGLLLFTWDTIGIIDFASMTNVTGEAWLRLPTTPQTPLPTPPPVPPTPPPVPPTPPPAGATLTLPQPLTAGTYFLNQAAPAAMSAADMTRYKALRAKATTAKINWGVVLTIAVDVYMGIQAGETAQQIVTQITPLIGQLGINVNPAVIAAVTDAVITAIADVRAGKPFWAVILDVIDALILLKPNAAAAGGAALTPFPGARAA